MSKFNWLLAGLMCACVLGCEGKPGSVQQAAISKQPKEPDAADAADPPPQSEPPLEDMPTKEAADAGSGEPAAEEPAAEETVLTLEQSGATFTLPAGWKRVKSDNRVVEAEFELPRAEGDEYDGRLTLMSSGGQVAQTIENRKGEFKFDDGEPPVEEKMEISGIDSTLLDLRGEWKGPFFKPINPPRPDYRMLLLIVHFSESSAFYAKLTGPRATVAAHEDEFREFIKSAKIKR